MIRFNVKSQSVKFAVKGSTALKMQVEPAVMVYTGSNPYEGPYEVTPKVGAQTLATAFKTMTEDMVVKAIPYYDVSNPKGGSTIYIGNEV